VINDDPNRTGTATDEAPLVSQADEEDPEWDAMLQRPATRGELLHMAQLFQLALLSQSMFGISHIEKDERLQRELGEKSLDHAIHIGKAMRTMLDRWKIEP
jgi:hypothetical protein